MVGSTPNHHVFCNNRKEKLKDVSTKTKERITRSTFKENICINVIKKQKMMSAMTVVFGDEYRYPHVRIETSKDVFKRN